GENHRAGRPAVATLRRKRPEPRRDRHRDAALGGMILAVGSDICLPTLIGRHGAAMVPRRQASSYFLAAMGRSQVVRQRILIPPFPGSSPGAPASAKLYLFESK